MGDEKPTKDIAVRRPTGRPGGKTARPDEKWILEMINWGDGSVENIANYDAVTLEMRTFSTREEAIRGTEHKIHRVFGVYERREPGWDPNEELVVTYIIARGDGAERETRIYKTSQEKCTAALPENMRWLHYVD